MDDTSPEGLMSHVPGARDLMNWFGYWPSFHDSEVTSIALARSGTSTISVHAFESTDSINERGQYVCQKHVQVKFLIDGIRGLELEGFNHQNVLAGLRLKKDQEGCQLELDGCFGVCGMIEAESVRIALAPGAPLDSQYQTEGTP